MAQGLGCSRLSLPSLWASSELRRPLGSAASRLGCAGVFVRNLVFKAHSSLGLTAAP